MKFLEIRGKKEENACCNLVICLHDEELKMLSSLVQEHNARQAGNKARQEKLRQEANKSAGKI